MQKNVASQKIGCQMVTAADGTAFTGSVTVYVTGDAGTQAVGSVGAGACTSEGNGYHTYAPAQAETNYDLIAFTFIGTGAIPATVQIYTRHDANVTHNAGTGITAAAGIQEVKVASIAASAITAASIAADAITDAKVASDVTIASVTGSVGSIATGGITTASFAAGAIDAAAIASDAIGSEELAASAITEIQSGLATSSALTSAASDITSIKTKTDFLPSATAGSAGGLFISGTNSSLTITGTMTVSGGIVVTNSNANTAAILATGNGSGQGLRVVGGSGAAGCDISGTGAASGLTIGAGSGAGTGLSIVGGGTSGVGISVTTTSGDGVSILPTAGHGILATANGTSKHGMQLTGSAAGTGDGVKFVAGTGGVDVRGTSSIADAVWDEAMAGHLAVGSYGERANVWASETNLSEVASDVDSILADVLLIYGVVNSILADTGTDGVVVNAAGLATDAVTEIVTAIFANAPTEAYATDGSAPTFAQFLYMIYSVCSQFDISSTTLTTRKLDGTTSAMVFTLDSASAPTSRVRSS